jgi:tetratricopeptide (TPR) repeat protein
MDHAKNGCVTRGSCVERPVGLGEAIADFTAAIEANSKFDKDDLADAYKKRADCHYQLGNHNEALRDIDIAIELRPEDEAFAKFRDDVVDGLAKSKPR